MRGKFRQILSDNLIRISLIFSIAILVVNLILVVFFLPKLPPYIPFFNSMPWGEDRLASSNVILFLPLISIMVIVLDNFISALYYTKYTLAARILSVSAVLFVFLGFLASLQIILLVF